MYRTGSATDAFLIQPGGGNTFPGGLVITSSSARRSSTAAAASILFCFGFLLSFFLLNRRWEREKEKMIIITDKQLKSRAHFRIDYHLTRWRWYTEPRVELFFFFFLFKCKLFFYFTISPWADNPIKTIHQMASWPFTFASAKSNSPRNVSLYRLTGAFRRIQSILLWPRVV